MPAGAKKTDARVENEAMEIDVHAHCDFGWLRGARESVSRVAGTIAVVPLLTFFGFSIRQQVNAVLA